MRDIGRHYRRFTAALVLACGRPTAASGENGFVPGLCLVFGTGRSRCVVVEPFGSSCIGTKAVRAVHNEVEPLEGVFETICHFFPSLIVAI